jgi:hypothetical protein
MNNRRIRTGLTFIASLLLFALLSWIGGYNFDQRQPEVAILAFTFLCFSFLVSWVVYEVFPENEYKS